VACATRVTIIWRDRSVRNTWLEVTVLASPATGLAAPDVFYFGNLVGDAAAEGGTVERVTLADVEAPAANLTRAATIENPNDVDRNGRVNRADARAARRNLGAELYAVGPFGGTVDSAPAPPLAGLWNLVFRDEFASDPLDPVWHPAQYWDHSFTVVGGGSRSAYWGALIASALGRPLVFRRHGAVGPALGAARLAQVACGAGTVQGSCAPPAAIERVEPDSDLTQYYADRQPRFRSLYAALKSSFRD